ncbi:MAG TPA: chemotaxis protein CheB [Casimicrobiaceae bacterium]|nr:chemotaxis protein CheB [Casimicrobiaceae bacterium]
MAPFPIVGIGASAGGLEAFTELLAHLPLDTGMGFVLVQHLDPDHESALPQLLGRATSLPVEAVTDNTRVAPNRVYVIPPNASLVIVQGVLKLKPRRPKRAPTRTIDTFFESLAEDQRECAIGVVLSGTASDGTVGLEAIKAEGGITFAQDETARYDSMPRSAVNAGCVDFVLAPEAIAQELARIARHPYITGRANAPATPEQDHAEATLHEDDATPLPSGGHGAPPTGARQARNEATRGDAGATAGEQPAANAYKKILLQLRSHSGVDFSLYKSSTIQRRVARRIVLSKQSSPESYAHYLRGNTKELDALYTDVLISVTSFFRNPEAFDVLKEKVFPTLLQQRGDEPLRTWVLGCSTGQEAYSIAMAFTEAAEKAPRVRRLQIFATDLNDALLEKARRGLYAKSLADDIEPDRLRRFFVEEEEGYRIVKAMREMVVFARQNVIADPPFSRMDLVSCRNVLIYLEPDLQKKLLPVFHYALKPRGFLFLGNSESIGSFTDLFEPLGRKSKIYVKKAVATPMLQLGMRRDRGERLPMRPVSTAPADATKAFSGEQSAQREADRITVNQFAPPAVLVNADLQILQFRGPTGAFLAPPTGKASFDVLKMAREGLMLPLRTALAKAKKDNRTVRKENVRVDHDGASRTISLEVIPLRNLHERCFLIVFEDTDRTRVAEADAAAHAGTGRGKRRSPASDDARRIAELESTLGDTRDYLQSLQEQHEAANEELQASNEEVQSANEELQSINEELETSKEELESANEELSTINDEMANRNTELNRANNDLVNLQNSTRLSIVLLGRDLTIRHYSPQAAKQLKLVAADVGRRIGAVRHDLVLTDGDAVSGHRPAGNGVPGTGRNARKDVDLRGTPAALDLEGFVAEVIDSVRERECHVQDRHGRWYLLRARPYLTLDKHVDGAVLVLTDIDELTRHTQDIAAARDFAEAIIRTVRDPFVILDAGLRVERANDAFYDAFGVAPAETEGRVIFDLGNGQWNVPRLHELLEEILPGKSVFNGFEVTHDFAGIGRRKMLLNARALQRADGRPARILVGMEDVTEKEAVEEARRAGETHYRMLFAAAPMAIFVCDRDGVIRYYNRRAAELWGREPEIGVERYSGAVKLWLPNGVPLPHEHSPMAGVLATGVSAHNVELEIERPDGSRLSVLENFSPLKNESGAITGAITSFMDITEQKDATNALQRLSVELLDADRRKNEFLAMLAHELRNPLAPIRTALTLMRRTTKSAGGSPQPAVDMIDRQVGQLVRLVDDLLDVSRISRGQIELQRDEIELASTMHRAVETARPLLDAMEHELTLVLPAEPITVDADAIRLAQIVGNLLNNASKFTDRGGRLRLAIERDGGDIVIRVADNGIGIDKRQLPRVFDLFMQVDTSLTRSATGLGIGLGLVKQLVTLHGGSVEARSGGVGQGSEFIVRLPIVVTAPMRPAAGAGGDSPVNAAAGRILIADDNRDAASSIASLLRLDGNVTETAHDGLAAFTAAEAFRPGVILLDIGMPKMNGYDVARRIRAASWGRDIVLIALTGWGQPEDREKSREAGFDHHLVKPVDPSALTRLLAGIAERSK